MTPKIYEFSTFQEFFERVPADRMADCLAEMGINFSMAKNMMGIINPIAKSLGGSEYTTLFKKPFTWTDDKKGEIKAQIQFGADDDDKKTITILAVKKAKEENHERK